MEKLPGPNRSTVQLPERPCLFLQKTAYQPAVPNIIKAVRPCVTCLANGPDDCPKAKNKMEIHMLCFRIMNHHKKPAEEKP